MTRNELKEIIKEIYNKFNFEYGDEKMKDVCI